MKTLVFILALVSTFIGRVVDQNGEPIPYATVYPEIAPEWGTATNNDGFFRFEANLTKDSRIIVSCIGYEKKTVLAESLYSSLSPDGASLSSNTSDHSIILREQPIALEETVVAAKKSKQRNKRKQMAELLHAVYVKLEEQFPDDNAQYQVVSDVRMLSDGSTWGMEQMIANIVVLPERAKEGRDSVQFQGRFCKRFFDARKRAQADSILASDALERMEQKNAPKGHPANMLRRAANAVDSGVVVHHALFAIGNMRYDFEQAMTDTKHWTVSNESEGETVLTHTQSVSRYLGCFKMTFQRHYIIDSRTYEVRRFSEHAEVKVFIPFGIKLNADQLQMLNLVNMSENSIEKFRLKRLRGTVDLNTIYQRRPASSVSSASSVTSVSSASSTSSGSSAERVYILEKNMICDAHILGSKKAEIPLIIKATQRATDLKTENVKPLSPSQITRRVRREIVEIY